MASDASSIKNGLTATSMSLASTDNEISIATVSEDAAELKTLREENQRLMQENRRLREENEAQSQKNQDLEARFEKLENSENKQFYQIQSWIKATESLLRSYAKAGWSNPENWKSFRHMIEAYKDKDFLSPGVPMFIAISETVDLKFLKELDTAGFCDLSLKDNLSGVTPLMCLAGTKGMDHYDRLVPIAEWMLQKRPSLLNEVLQGTREGDGGTAFDIAVAAGNWSLAQYLKAQPNFRHNALASTNAQRLQTQFQVTQTYVNEPYEAVEEAFQLTFREDKSIPLPAWKAYRAKALTDATKVLNGFGLDVNKLK